MGELVIMKRISESINTIKYLNQLKKIEEL